MSEDPHRMDAYHIIYLLKGIGVFRMEADARSISVEMRFTEPVHDVARGPRPALSRKEMAAFALDFPATIRKVMQDLVLERDDLRDRLHELEIASRAGYMKVSGDELDGLVERAESQQGQDAKRKPAATPADLAARLQAIRKGGPRAGLKGTSHA